MSKEEGGGNIKWFLEHKGGNTSHMLQHFIKYHKLEHQAQVSKESGNRIHQTSQSSITAFTTTAEFQARHEQNLLALVVNSFHPLNIVENADFRAMLTHLNPKVLNMSTVKLKANIERKASDVKAVLKGELLNKVRGCSLTLDHWTDISNRSWLAVTIHFIDRSWKLDSFILSCTHVVGEHNAIGILKQLETVLGKWELNLANIIAVVSDSAPVMNSFGVILKERYPTCAYHFCLDHVLELTTKITGYYEGELMKKARGLVVHFNASSQASESLKNIQLQNNVNKPIGMLGDVVTRWWSSFTMLKRLLDLRLFLGLLEQNHGLTGNLNNVEWDELKRIHDLLKPFMLVQRDMEGEKYVTISRIPMEVRLLRRGLQSSADDPAHTAGELAKALIEDPVNGFNIYWGSGAIDTEYNETETLGARNRIQGVPKVAHVAVALDCRSKDLRGYGELDKELIWKDLRERMKEVNPKVATDVQRVMPPQVEDGERNIDEIVEALYGNGGIGVPIAVPTAADTLDLLLDNELNAYKIVPNTPFKIQMEFTNPLDWWKKWEKSYPHLAYLASQILAVPATSAPSERCFSISGLLLSKKRATLNSDSAGDLIFLKGSLEKAKQYSNRL
jgi:hypothetical protein